MAFINTKKRKLAEDAHGAKNFHKSHKRHSSDHAPLSSIDFQAAVQPGNRKTADAASSLEEVSEKGNGSEADEEDLEEDEDEDKEDDDNDNENEQDGENEGEEEPKPEFEENRARRLEEKASPKRNPPVSDPESDPSPESSTEWASDAMTDSDVETHPDDKKKEVFKADDPSAFSSSISAILGYKLTRTQRANPILARSADAKAADEALLDLKLEKKARAEVKREKLEKESQGGGAGNLVVPTFGIDDHVEMESIVAYQKRERELRKLAEKGVIKMFNAFTHVREKAVEAQATGGSRAKKEEKATEMTKEGWLEYVGHGGKDKIEEKGKSKAVLEDGNAKKGTGGLR